MHATTLVSLVASAALAVAIPAPSPVVAVEGRAATSASYAPVTDSSQMIGLFRGLIDDGKDLAMGGKEILGVLDAIVPISKPKSIPEAMARLAKLYSQNYGNLFINGGEILLNGLAPGDASAIRNDLGGYNSYGNRQNPHVAGIYPKKSAEDAPYETPEERLREAIFFPPGFTHGRVRPVIFVPGTGGFAGQHFAANAGKLFAGSSFADPVYLNVPGAQLDDIQTNSEYVAYAINYVAALTGTRPSLYTWSAGALASRWAGKYWPSTRGAVTNAVAVSADYHGTTLAYLLDPQYPRGQNATPPAVVQQEYNSTFLATLRNNGGDSPFYPLTSIFSAFDEIVEPQGATGVLEASGYSSDRYGVGVANLFLQHVCPVQTLGGTLTNTHEGILINALVLAAAEQALRTGKTADLSAFDAAAECFKFAADGLSLSDILATDAVIPIAAAEIAAYPSKVGPEPTIKPYAQKDIPAGYCNGC